MGKSVKKYQIKEYYLKNLLMTVNQTEILPDINEFVQQIFFENDNSFEIDALCVIYYQRHEHGFQYLRLKLSDYDVSDELAKTIFRACLELNFSEATAVFDHLSLSKPDLQEVLIPLIIEHQVKLFRETIRVRFQENKTNRLLSDYRTKLIEALVSEAI